LFRGKASQKISNVIFLQYPLVRFNVRYVYSVESADEANGAMDSIVECSSNPVRPSQTLTSKGKLPQCLGIGDNVNRCGVVVLCIKQSSFEGEGLSQHAAVINGSIHASSEESGRLSSMMMGYKAKPHKFVGVASILNDGRVNML
jgi:hypothetical protein